MKTNPLSRSAFMRVQSEVVSSENHKQSSQTALISEQHPNSNQAERPLPDGEDIEASSQRNANVQANFGNSSYHPADTATSLGIAGQPSKDLLLASKKSNKRGSRQEFEHPIEQLIKLEGSNVHEKAQLSFDLREARSRIQHFSPQACRESSQVIPEVSKSSRVDQDSQTEGRNNQSEDALKHVNFTIGIDNPTQEQTLQKSGQSGANSKRITHYEAFKGFTRSPSIKLLNFSDMRRLPVDQKDPQALRKANQSVASPPNKKVFGVSKRGKKASSSKSPAPKPAPKKSPAQVITESLKHFHAHLQRSHEQELFLEKAKLENQAYHQTDSSRAIVNPPFEKTRPSPREESPRESQAAFRESIRYINSLSNGKILQEADLPETKISFDNSHLKKLAGRNTSDRGRLSLRQSGAQSSLPIIPRRTSRRSKLSTQVEFGADPGVPSLSQSTMTKTKRSLADKPIQSKRSQTKKCGSPFFDPQSWKRATMYNFDRAQSKLEEPTDKFETQNTGLPTEDMNTSLISMASPPEGTQRTKFEAGSKFSTSSGTGLPIMNKTQLSNPISRLSLRMNSPIAQPLMFSEDLFGDPKIMEQLTKIATKKHKFLARDQAALGSLSSLALSSTTKFSQQRGMNILTQQSRDRFEKKTSPFENTERSESPTKRASILIKEGIAERMRMSMRGSSVFEPRATTPLKSLYSRVASNQMSPEECIGEYDSKNPFDDALHVNEMKKKRSDFMKGLAVADTNLNQIVQEEQKQFDHWKTQQQFKQGLRISKVVKKPSQMNSQVATYQQTRPTVTSSVPSKKLPKKKTIQRNISLLVDDQLIFQQSWKGVPRETNRSTTSQKSVINSLTSSHSSYSRSSRRESKNHLKVYSVKGESVPERKKSSVFRPPGLHSRHTTFNEKNKRLPKLSSSSVAHTANVDMSKRGRYLDVVDIEVDSVSELSDDPSISNAIEGLRAVRSKVKGVKPKVTDEYRTTFSNFKPGLGTILVKAQPTIKMSHPKESIEAQSPGRRSELASPTKRSDLSLRSRTSVVEEEEVSYLYLKQNHQLSEADLRKFIEGKIMKDEVLKKYDNEAAMILQMDPSKLNAYLAYLTRGVIENEIIFKFARQLKNRLQLDLVAKFNQKNDLLIDYLISELLAKIEFKKLCQESKAKESASFKFSNEQRGVTASLQFFKFCEKEGSLALPIFQKIFAKQLTLVDYQLNQGICTALAAGFKCNDKVIERLHLDNCGVQDYEQSIILEGVNSLHHISSLTLAHQEVGPYSVQRLGEILHGRIFPCQLQELKLVENKINHQDTVDLVSHLCAGAHVRTLVLKKASLSKESIRLLCKYISENPYLRCLDLSQSDLSCQMYLPLLETLGQQVNLQEVNLSYNQLVPQRENPYERQVQTKLLNLVYNNQSLQHLFLEGCGLTEAIVSSIIHQAKFSPSLVSIHFSNNPCIDGQAKKRLASILNVNIEDEEMDGPMEEEEGDFDIEKTKELNFKEIDKKKRNLKTAKTFIRDNPVQLEEQPTQLSAANKEQLQVRKILKDKAHEAAYQISHVSYHSRIFIMQRYLGFDEELQTVRAQSRRLTQKLSSLSSAKTMPMRKPSDWTVLSNRSQECWMCHRHIYSLFFWNTDIGESRNLEIANKRTIIRNLKRPSFKTNRPVLYLFQNGWQGVEMHTVSEYCFIIDKRKNPRFNSLPLAKVKNFEFSGEKDMDSQYFDSELFQQLHHYRHPRVFREVIHHNLGFRDPQFVNSHPFCLLQMERPELTTFVLPQFLKAGRLSYIIEYPEGKFYFHKCLVHFRKEMLLLKTVDVSDHLDNKEPSAAPNPFNKPTSAFKDYQEDTVILLQKSVMHDLRNINFKALQQSKFKSNSKELSVIIERNFKDLKHAFRYALAHSKTPEGVDFESFLSFCQHTCRVSCLPKYEEVFRSHYVETLNPDGLDSPDSSKEAERTLQRWEFIEMIVRISRYEYPTDASTTALNHFISVNLNSHIPASLFQEFREKIIWTVEVDNLLRENIASIRDLIRSYEAPMTFQKLKQMFVDDARVLKDQKILVKACALSKFTVETDLIDEYTESEVLEVIARVADLASHGSAQEDLMLAGKIEQILDPLLKGTKQKMKLHKKWQEVTKMVLKEVS